MKKFLSEFREFAVRGSVVDLAIGIIIGGAFNGLVNSLVKDIVMPPIGLFLNRVDFSNLYISLNSGARVNYGNFLNLLISFLITALVVFLLVRKMNALRRRHDAGKELLPSTKPCPYCFTSVPLKATRCPACTSEIK